MGRIGCLDMLCSLVERSFSHHCVIVVVKAREVSMQYVSMQYVSMHDS